MFCPKCGKETSPFAKYCDGCGAEIPEAAEQNVPQSDISETNVRPVEYTAPTQPMTYENVPPAQPMTFQSVQELPEAEIPSRYQEISMGDVVAQKKSYKKIIIAVISILLVISLVVGGFFIYRLIKKNTVFSKIKEQPTAYLVSAYESTIEAVGSNSDVIKVLSGQPKQGTVTTVIDYGENGTQTAVTAVDANTKQYYQSVKTDNKGKEGTFELYADLNKVVLKSANENRSFDYFLGLKDLRTNAADSIIGYNGADSSLTKEQYDTAMDIYEYFYNGISKDTDDMFGLKSFGEKLCKDIDECGKVEVTEGSTEIFGADTPAFVVAHSFKDTSIVNAVYVDFKDWAKNNIKINDKIDAQIMSAIEKVDPIQFTSQLDSSDYEVSFKHYINKDKGTIMKAEFCVTYQKQSVTLTFIFGADPSSSDKAAIELSVMGVKETMTITKSNSDSQEKLICTLEGMLLDGNITYTRDKATGDFTIEPNVKAVFLGVTNGPKDRQLELRSIKGNLKTTGDSITIRIANEEEGGLPASVEYTISTKAEIKELSSENDLLKVSKEDLIENFKDISLVMPITTVSKINP